MPGATPQYPPEFRAEALRLYRSSDRSVSEVARELGISPETLRNWVNQDKIDAGVDFTLSTVLGLLAVVGVVIGAHVAHTVPETALRRVAAVSLIAVGLLIAGRSIAQLG